MTQNKEIVVLLSGGIDSALCLDKAVAEVGRENVHCFFIDYGQKQIKEEYSAAIELCSYYGVESESYAIQLPTCVDEQSALVLGRNAVLVSLACSWAESIGARFVYVGANKDDYEDYPDCRPRFYAMYNSMLDAAKMKVLVRTPYITETKAEIVYIAKQRGVPLHLTWSCYSPNLGACGHCNACKLRDKAFNPE